MAVFLLPIKIIPIWNELNLQQNIKICVSQKKDKKHKINKGKIEKTKFGLTDDSQSIKKIY